MMRQAVHFIPIATTLIALVFAIAILRHYHRRGSGLHLLWWGIGLLLFAAGTFTESAVTLFGWTETTFRAWYITGALLGGAPLAQGTAYLLLRRRTANWFAAGFIPYVIVAAVCLMLSPINEAMVEPYRLSGSVVEWQWVRLFSPLINTYAVIFLIGGAALSAFRYRKREDSYHRFVGNVLIAIGATLPGIGGIATRAGYTEVLYVGEFLGIILIWMGYRWNVRVPIPAREPARVTDSIQPSPT